MHQKYIVHPEGQTVLTGTANLSTDASQRHSEHRILWRGDKQATDAFVADFMTMWQRLAPPFASKAAGKAWILDPAPAVGVSLWLHETAKASIPLLLISASAGSIFPTISNL